MQDFDQWSLDAIRAEGAILSWLEESRFYWTSTTSHALEQILNAKSMVIITDIERKWFESYVLSSINSLKKERPLIPIISMDALYAHYNRVSSGEALDIIEDMLSIALGEEYFFWYIGKGDDKRADIAKRKDNSYFWILDEDYHNSFRMSSHDKHLDIKLLQLYKLFDASLSAKMFGEIDATI